MMRSRSRRPMRYYGTTLGIALFLLPGLGLYTILMLYPTLQSIVYSLLRWEGLRATREFVGLGNYARLLRDPVVRIALTNNLRAWILRAFVQLPLALLLAFALTRKVRLVALFRFLYYIPCVCSGSMLALMWLFIFTAQYGLNNFLRTAGLESLTRPWLSGDGIVQWTTNFPATWQWVGFYMVIFLAAIGSIPEEYFEAAQIDGANAWQQLIYITLPSIRLVYVAASITVLKDSLGTYIYQFIMTEGGPLHMSETLVTYTLNEIWTEKNWGYGSALAVLHFALAAVVTGLIWRFTRRTQDL
jgi:raffinose/stachyose/melibiose transport system permease protein